MAVKIGELQSEITDDVKKTDSLRVLMRVNMQVKVKEITFQPSQDLKKGDRVKITVEKI